MSDRLPVAVMLLLLAGCGGLPSTIVETEVEVCPPQKPDTRMSGDARWWGDPARSVTRLAGCGVGSRAVSGSGASMGSGLDSMPCQVMRNKYLHDLGQH